MKKIVSDLQEVTTNTWPPMHIHFVNGWTIRLAEGITNRANSVLPLHYTGNDILKDIKDVETIYRENNLIPTFQLSDYFEPKNLRSALHSMNYYEMSETQVMTAQMEDLIRNNFANISKYNIFLSNPIEWFKAFKILRPDIEPRINGIEEIIKRIKTCEVNYFLGRQNNKPIAMGLSVLDRDFLVIYNMFTDKNYRRKGLAASIIRKILDLAKKKNVSRVFLQVEVENTGAIQLYSKFGFKDVFRYRYLKKKSL